MKFVLLLLLVGCTASNDVGAKTFVTVTFKDADFTHGGCGGKFAEYKIPAFRFRNGIRYCTQECGSATIPIPCEFYDELK